MICISNNSASWERVNLSPIWSQSTYEKRQISRSSIYFNFAAGKLRSRHLTKTFYRYNIWLITPICWLIRLVSQLTNIFGHWAATAHTISLCSAQHSLPSSLKPRNNRIELTCVWKATNPHRSLYNPQILSPGQVRKVPVTEKSVGTFMDGTV